VEDAPETTDEGMKVFVRSSVVSVLLPMSTKKEGELENEEDI
jgi:hypothetical protein